MNKIFFEKQEAALCAQHALNMLLQNNYFSPVDLAEIAQKLDREENGVLEHSERNARSVNMDETGFFSVQVVSQALEPFSLDLIHIDHPSVADIKANPLNAKAFICNQSEHWFTVRKFGFQWFLLNSVKAGPELLSDTYLSMYLHQLRTEGYTIFVVRGILPNSEADQFIAENPVVQYVPPKKTDKSDKTVSMGVGRRLGSALDTVISSLSGGNNAKTDEERQLEEAIKLSLGANPSGSTTPSVSGSVPSNRSTDEEELQKAIQMSLQENSSDDVQIALMKSLDEKESVKVRNVPIQIISASTEVVPQVVLDSVSESSEADIIRQRREAFLNRFN